MTYLTDLLARDETVILQARRHPLFMALHSGPYVLGAVLLWIVTVLAIAYVPEVLGVPVNVIIALSLLAVSVVLLLIGLYRVLIWRNEQYVVTNLRILQVEGFMNRRSLDSALEMVNDVELRQSIFGRMFNYGSIHIITGSDAAINDIAGVTRPFEFKRALLEAKLAYGSSRSGSVRAAMTSTSPSGAANADTDKLPDVDSDGDQSKAIIALTELRNSGILSESEYSEKLRKLIGSG